MTHLSMLHRAALVPALLCAVVVTGCKASPPEPSPDPNRSTESAKKAAEDAREASSLKPASGKKKIKAKPVAAVKPSPDDPVKGDWPLDEATKGLTKGKLSASIETDLGTLTCSLFDDKAPITVANFVGLARGLRPWKTPEGKWEKKPAYDGTIFHRVIQGFMIQGGDAKKDGTGEAGYVIPDEIWEDANHDRAGLLCMANRGPNTNSAQFFITDAAAAHLDGGYTIFGECGPEDLVHKLAAVEIGSGDRPKSPPVIKKVTVTSK